MSDSVQPHPWDSPGKNTGVGCHFLLQCIKVKSESEVAQSCLTLRDYQAPPSMGFSRQEHWSGAPLPSPQYSPWGRNESDTTERLSTLRVLSLDREDPLEEMATSSSILACRIPWTEKPGYRPVSQRVGHD